MRLTTGRSVQEMRAPTSCVTGWVGIERIVYAANREDAAAIGFDDVEIYQQVMLPPSQRHIPMQQQLRDEALQTFELWKNLEEKVEY